MRVRPQHCEDDRVEQVCEQLSEQLDLQSIQALHQPSQVIYPVQHSSVHFMLWAAQA